MLWRDADRGDEAIEVWRVVASAGGVLASSQMALDGIRDGFLGRGDGLGAGGAGQHCKAEHANGISHREGHDTPNLFLWLLVRHHSRSHAVGCAAAA
jgi:hypothetical protein